MPDQRTGSWRVRIRRERDDGAGRFNPRPPRGGRLARLRLAVDGTPCFNPRPPRGGRPLRDRRSTEPVQRFNPRPPRGGRHWADPPPCEA